MMIIKYFGLFSVLLHICVMEETEMQGLASMLKKLEKTVAVMENSIRDIQLNFDQRLKKVEGGSCNQQQETTAGFTAVKETYDHSNTGDIIVFDTELYDAANAYNSATGIYTCPADGVYLFSTNVYVDNDDQVILCIRINGVKFSCGYNGPDMGDDTSLTVVANCLVNQQVSVEVEWGSAYIYGNWNGETLSSFSGHLVSLTPN